MTTSLSSAHALASPSGKRILLLKANGEQQELQLPLPLKRLQELVGGFIEHVRVLVRVENGRGVYTSMYINDEGLLNDLPRNEKATELYQRNVRMRFPNAKNPFLAAKEAMRKTAEQRGVFVIEAAQVAPGYDADPWIAGDAIFFDGYTCEEADEALNG